MTTWRLVLLGLVTALGPLSIDLYLPAFPELADELATSEAAVQLTLTACVVGLALGQLVAGPWSDARGRKAPVVAGLLAWSAASLACAVAPSITTLTLLRLAQGLAGAIGAAVARAVVRDLADGDQLTRAYARLMLVVGVVPIAAPSVGGLLLGTTDWRGLFVVLALAGALVTVLVAVGLPETLPAHLRRSGVRRSLESYGVLLRDARFVGPALVVGLVFAAMFSYVSVSPFVLRDGYDLSAATYGLLFGVNAVGLVLGTQASAALVARVPSAAVLRGALLAGAAAGLAMLAAAATGALGLWGVAVPLLVVVTSVGVGMPVASAWAMQGHPERAGAASGLLGVFQFLLGGVLAPVVGAFGGGSAVPLAAAVVLLLGVALAASRRPAPAAA
ncbi:Bcr/CflA family efflux MFS transporter [Vallicoccus soli]|uniref:Bcr/CflA family efflux MFS transporter n=2 Tax=Vallicoccus soli TaxID=2339232 RepID=A0A3A3Z1M6_9ACTN|nr:Bcr/CflA family efflux MFS transporter [Vallicoccus soli]